MAPTADASEPRAAAHWKKRRFRSRSDQDEKFVAWCALCGTTGCPGSLGGLIESPAVSEGQAVRDDQQRVNFYDETIDHFSRRAKRLIQKADNAAAQQRVEETHSRMIKHFAREREMVVRGRDGELGTLRMSLTAPPHMPTTLPQNQPDPIYYGFADTGYRISTKGNREPRDGDRRGRRQFRGPQSRFPLEAPGVVVTPPCLIWCPICGRLNDVGLPPGFEPSPAP